MAQRLSPEELAEAPPNEPSHPAVVERVIEQMADTAGWIDRVDAAVFATGGGRSALLRLRDSVEAAARHAGLGRRVTSQP